MISIMFAMALAGSPAEESKQPQTYEAVFRPLKKSERSYVENGPAGAYYPQRAFDARLSGHAVISCQASAGGELEHCKPISETPWNSNFAIAARIMADRKRIVVAEPLTPGETILVRVPFVLGAPVAVEP